MHLSQDLTVDQTCWIGRVEIRNEFGSMSKFGSEDPGSFFVSASYPVQRTRYNTLQAQHRLSILESRISEISNSGSSSKMIGGVGLNSIGNWIRSCWFQH